MPIPTLSDDHLLAALAVGLPKLHQDLKTVLHIVREDPARRVLLSCVEEVDRLYSLVHEHGIHRALKRMEGRP